MSQTQDTIVAALMEQLIAEGPDGMAQVFTTLFNLAMRLERERFLGAGLYERNPDRRGYANGYESKTLDTTAGTVTVDVPKAAGIDEPFYPQSLERGRRSSRAVMLAIAERYVQGVSTRDAAKVMAEFGLKSLSSTQVGRAAALLDEQLAVWRRRPLGESHYLLLDARYEKLREGGVVRDAALSRHRHRAGRATARARRLLRSLGSRNPLARLPRQPDRPRHARRPLRRQRRPCRAEGRPPRRPARHPLAALSVPPRAERHSPRPQRRHPQAHWRRAATDLERLLAAHRAGRTRPPGRRLPWHGRPPRRLARAQRPRRLRRLHPAGAALAAHADRQPHRAGDPAGDQTPHQQGPRLPQPRCPAPPRHRRPRRNRRRLGNLRPHLHQLAQPGCLTASTPKVQTSGCSIDRFPLVTQRSQPGEIVGQVACRHSLEESIDGVLQDSMVTVDPAECQGAGAAPGQSGSLLFGSWLDWLDGAMLAGDQVGQLWIGAEAVGADQRSRCDGTTQSDDDVVFTAPVQDSLDHTARTIQRGDDGHQKPVSPTPGG